MVTGDVTGGTLVSVCSWIPLLPPGAALAAGRVKHEHLDPAVDVAGTVPVPVDVAAPLHTAMILNLRLPAPVLPASKATLNEGYAAQRTVSLLDDTCPMTHTRRAKVPTRACMPTGRSDHLQTGRRCTSR